MSKIPEGATHKTSRGEYRRIVGDDVYVCSGDNWVCVYSDPRAREGCIPLSKEWSGEGLPPVGAVVFCGTHNRKVEILKDPELVPYVSAPFRALDNNELFWGGNFTPIKTPEQIAADENRLRGIEEIHEILLKRIGISDLKLVSGFYDAHRKQVAK